jgi:hypothetical protein
MTNTAEDSGRRAGVNPAFVAGRPGKIELAGVERNGVHTGVLWVDTSILLLGDVAFQLVSLGGDHIAVAKLHSVPILSATQRDYYPMQNQSDGYRVARIEIDRGASARKPGDLFSGDVLNEPGRMNYIGPDLQFIQGGIGIADHNRRGLVYQLRYPEARRGQVQEVQVKYGTLGLLDLVKKHDVASHVSQYRKPRTPRELRGNHDVSHPQV